MIYKSAEDIIKLVQSEIESISDLELKNAINMKIVNPTMHFRNWDYGKPDERYPCWTILEHRESNTAIVYSDFGFGPKCPWGLVAINDIWFGMDSGWFSSLVDAFCDSFASEGLKIWKVIEKLPTGEVNIINDSLTQEEAYEIWNKLPRPKDIETILHFEEYYKTHSEYEVLHNY